MRRSLPFEDDDLLGLLDWCNGSEQLSMHTVPVGHITRALQRFLETHALSDALRERITRFAGSLRESYDKDVARYGTAVEQLLAGPTAALGAAQTAEPNDGAEAAPSAPPAPAAAGNPAVLDAIKRQLGVAGEDVAAEELQPDGFPLRTDSPFRPEHALLSEMLASVVGTRDYMQPTLETLRGGDRVLRLDPVASGRLLLAAAERDVSGFLARTDVNTPAAWQSRYAVASITKTLAQRPFELDRDGMVDFLLYVAMRAAPWDRRPFEAAVATLVDHVGQEATRTPLSDGERYVLYLLRAAWIGRTTVRPGDRDHSAHSSRGGRRRVLPCAWRGVDRPAQRRPDAAPAARP